MSGGADLVTVADADAAATAAVDAIAGALREAVGERGRADYAVTGGTAAVPMYRQLASDPLRARIPWSDVHIWWGDDRFVPYDHPLSNVLPVEQILLAAGRSEVGLSGNRGDSGRDASESLPLRGVNIHRFPNDEALAGGQDAAWCAARYASELRELGPGVADGGWPVLDLIVLGVGADGHILSVFPDSGVWDSDAWTAGVPAPTHIEPHVERVTLHPEVVRVARRVIVVVTGAGKADALGKAWSPGAEREVPARIAVRPGATWFVDRAAAAGLSR